MELGIKNNHIAITNRRKEEPVLSILLLMEDYLRNEQLIKIFLIC